MSCAPETQATTPDPCDDSVKLTATFIQHKKSHSQAGSPSPRLSMKALKLLAYTARNNWICPQHEEWMEMWNMLPEIDGCKPGGPLPLIAWKLWDLRIRNEFLVRHIKCADERGVIDEVDEFLRSLPPEKWIDGLLTIEGPLPFLEYFPV